jgi:L,D-peptidoglycan transpeptidase YkuD (ErfK/YbiS/YcfS/YnhG family)
VKEVIFVGAFLLIASLLRSEQLVVVISPEMNQTKGSLQRYEKGKMWEKRGEAIAVTLGRNGLGWEGDRLPQKHEGDGRSPAGVFLITSTFGYAPTGLSAMPYWYANDHLICVDEVSDARYNTMAIFKEGETLPKSYEQMHRKDGVYRYGAVIGYNPTGEKGRGSCLFFHLNHANHRPTAGCTAMEEKPLIELLRWLDPLQKPRLLQIPQSSCAEYQKVFEGILCN